MIPIIVLIGRPNVGKSTLFNHLTKKKNALVHHIPNSTRDRQYGYLHGVTENILIVDTAGINKFNYSPVTVENNILVQTVKSIEEAHLIIFVINMEEGITEKDQEIIKFLRKKKKSIFLVVNKIDKIKNYNLQIHEYYCFGIKNIISIAAITKKGINILIEKHLKPWIAIYYKSYQKKQILSQTIQDIKYFQNPHIPQLKISLIGKPNVGKSTLLNVISNQERVVTYNAPGTTRDSIAVPICFKKKKYVVIDTAGIKKNTKIKETIQYLAQFKTISSIKQSDISILVIDAIQGASNQDLSILNTIIELGKTVIIIINKSEHLSSIDKINIKKYLILKNSLIKFISIHFISALYKHEKEINKIFQLINQAYHDANKLMKSSELTKIMQNAIHLHPPALANGKKIKLKYAHPGGYNPPTIIIHGNQTSEISNMYKRYLIIFFQKSLNIHGTIIKLVFKKNKNPYI